MRRVVLALLCVVAVGALVANRFPRSANPQNTSDADDARLVLRGAVERVRDGDGAFVRLDSGRMEVRFYGIDAPELKGPFGREAKLALERLIGGRDVELQPVSQDRYERIVAVVLVNGASVNEAMIAQGYAWAYRDYLGQISGEARYCELEAGARAARRGLWSQPPQSWLPPWIYRARARGERGARVASRDYSGETAADCLAAVAAARERRLKQSPQLPAAPESRPQSLPKGATCRIKGNINGKGERIYHLPGSPSYEDTRIDERSGERWFCTEDEARAAGWRAPRQLR